MLLIISIKLIFPYVDLNIQYYDLSIQKRDEVNIFEYIINLKNKYDVMY